MYKLYLMTVNNLCSLLVLGFVVVLLLFLFLKNTKHSLFPSIYKE